MVVCNQAARRRGASRAHRLATVGRLGPGALHELANPLLALLGTVELVLAEAEPGSELATRLTVVKETGAEIASITRALQRLVRKRGQPEERLELGSFVEETVGLARLLGAVRDIALQLRADGDADVVARAADLRSLVLGALLDGLDASEPRARLDVVVSGRTVSVSAGSETNALLGPAAAAFGAVVERGAAGGVTLRF